MSEGAKVMGAIRAMAKPLFANKKKNPLEKSNQQGINTILSVYWLYVIIDQSVL